MITDPADFNRSLREFVPYTRVLLFFWRVKVSLSHVFFFLYTNKMFRVFVPAQFRVLRECFSEVVCLDLGSDRVVMWS